MYPVFRMIWQIAKIRKAAALPITGTHVSDHLCLPWDIDLWRELNNGRTLTLFDMGRIPLVFRIGLAPVLKRERWGLTMAGAHVRYRRRIRMFEKIKMRSRVICWDDRFIYLEQSMWKAGTECANHALYRSAVTGRDGIISPQDVLRQMGQNATSPPMPDWVQVWVDADAVRPWPPIQA